MYASARKECQAQMILDSFLLFQSNLGNATILHLNKFFS